MSDYIYLIVGESGVGKTTLVEYLEWKYKLKSIQSYTTRLPRYEGEKGHTFVTQGEFVKLKNLVGYTCFDRHEYCATTEQVECCDLYVIDKNGVDFFKEKYEGSKIPVVVYLYASIETRIGRMRNRGESGSDIVTRIEHDKVAFADLEYNIKLDTENKTISEIAEEFYKVVEKGVGKI